LFSQLHGTSEDGRVAKDIRGGKHPPDGCATLEVRKDRVVKSEDLVNATMEQLPEEVRHRLESALDELSELVGAGMALEDLQELMRATFVAGVRMGIELCEGPSAVEKVDDNLGDN
jgi:hypothetical protein